MSKLLGRCTISAYNLYIGLAQDKSIITTQNILIKISFFFNFNIFTKYKIQQTQFIMVIEYKLINKCLKSIICIKF